MSYKIFITSVLATSYFLCFDYIISVMIPFKINIFNQNPIYISGVTRDES